MKQKVFCFLLAILVIFSNFAVCEESDFNRDCVTDIADALLPLKVSAGLDADEIRQDWKEAGLDVNNDNRIGIEEVIMILRRLADIISAYEDDDTPEQANVIIFNDSCFQQHNFHDSGDADWIKFYAVKEMPYSIEATNIGELSDVRIELYDTDGKTRLALLDGKGTEFNTLYWGNPDDWTDREEGYYYLKLTNTNPDSSGNDTEYKVQINRYEDNDSFEQANLIVTDIVQHHNFHDKGDNDWVMFYAEEGETYTIEAGNPGIQCIVGLELYDTDGKTFTDFFAYSSSYGKNAAFTWKCGEDGIYFVKAFNTDSVVYGKDTEYDLKITFNTAPMPLGKISGYVLDASSGLKIMVQGLTIKCSSGTLVYYNSTYGIFYVSGLEKGTYTLTANAPGYKTSVTSVKVKTSSVKRDIYMSR